MGLNNMKQVLITLGDSWPEGAELRGGKPYGELLYEQQGFDEFYNFGSGGASVEDLVIQFKKFLDNNYGADNQTTAIFFLTNPARTAFFPRFFSWGEITDKNLRELYLHFHTKSLEVQRYSQTITTLQTWCKKLRIQDYYFAGWNRYEEWLECVDLTKIWAQGRETAADWFGASKHNGEHLLDVNENPWIRPNFAHPNQDGHQLIADKLASWIQIKQ